MVEVNVDKFYSNRALYPFIPEAVFDALEAAYLSGNECARIPEGEYNTMMSNLKRANLRLDIIVLYSPSGIRAHSFPDK